MINIPKKWYATMTQAARVLCPVCVYVWCCVVCVSLRNCLSGSLPFSSVSPFPLLEVTRSRPTADVI